ncbi:MAG: N-acyl homoserine lactonase family protein [Pseudomonadota bacterium]
MSDWDVYAISYAERVEQLQADSLVLDADHMLRHPMDYYIWVLRRDDELILVDTGYDTAEGTARGRPVIHEPPAALAPLGIRAEDVTQIIVTHLHYDHAGGLHLFPNAILHMQEAEMAFATGRCMCHPLLRSPFTGAHICEAVRRLYAGKVVFHDGDAEIAEGVTVHRTGGHSRGLQCVRVRTRSGWMVLASDTSHFYENFWHDKPFAVVVDVVDALDGFATLRRLVSRPELIVPGHDPLVQEYFARGPAPFITRLDPGPIRAIEP